MRPGRRRLLALGAAVVAAAFARVTWERRARAAPPPRGDAPAWEPRMLARLASWVPAPPATPVERLRAYALAAPLTLAGLLVGALSGVRPRRRAGALVFEHARGPFAAYLRSRRFSAATLGHVIVATRALEPPLLAHELVHVRQGERLGVLLAPLYLALLIVYGYHAHPLERAARSVQRDVESPPSPAGGEQGIVPPS